MKLNFMKIWSWGVQNHHNYHKVQFEWFHSLYNNIIVDYEKKTQFDL